MEIVAKMIKLLSQITSVGYTPPEPLSDTAEVQNLRAADHQVKVAARWLRMDLRHQMIDARRIIEK